VSSMLARRTTAVIGRRTGPNQHECHLAGTGTTAPARECPVNVSGHGVSDMLVSRWRCAPQPLTHLVNTWSLLKHGFRRDLEAEAQRPVRLQVVAFRRRRSYRRLWQTHPILYRGDVDDYAGALFDHGRYERTIQTHGGEQVLIERRGPLLIVEYRKTSGRSRRAADDVHNAVHAAEMLADASATAAPW